MEGRKDGRKKHDGGGLSVLSPVFLCPSTVLGARAVAPHELPLSNCVWLGHPISTDYVCRALCLFTNELIYKKTHPLNAIYRIPPPPSPSSHRLSNLATARLDESLLSLYGQNTRQHFFPSIHTSRTCSGGILPRAACTSRKTIRRTQARGR